MQYCDQTCAWCAKHFFKFWQNREVSQSMPRKKFNETISFQESAVTSVRATNAVS